MAKINPEIPLNDPGSATKNGTQRTPTLAGAPTKLMVAEIRDDEGNVTGYKLQSISNKFGVAEKDIVVKQLADHGRIGAAARAAGVTISTVKRHVKQDANFAECVAEALEVYKDRLLAHHQKLVFEGETKKTYDRDGHLISEEVRYPVRLIELELKKHDTGYREKQEHHHEHRGGVMVAPAEVKDVSDWESKFGRKEESEIIDAEATEIEDKDSRT